MIGMVRLQCRTKDGDPVWDTGFIRNQITESGIAEVVALMGDIGSPAPFTFLALGNDDTAATAADTELGAEITGNDLERQAATVTSEETNFADDTLQLQAEWTASGSEEINEIGVFNDASAGEMLGRLLTGSRNVEATMIVTATYKIILTI